MKRIIAILTTTLISSTFTFAGNPVISAEPIVIKGKRERVYLDPPLNGPGSSTLVVTCVGTTEVCATINLTKSEVYWVEHGIEKRYKYDRYESVSDNNSVNPTNKLTFYKAR